MHTVQADDGTLFHYSSDFSWDVIVEGSFGEVRLNGDAILAFVAKSYCLPAKIDLLEEIGADSEALLCELRQAEPQALLLGTV